MSTHPVCIGVPPPDLNQPKVSAASSRQTSLNRLDSGGASALSSASETCLTPERLHGGNRKTMDMGPTCWDDDKMSLHADDEVADRPSLNPVASNGAPGYTTPPGLAYPPPRSSVPSLSVPYPGVDPGLMTSLNTGYLDIRGLMPSSVKRPRGGIQPRTYPFETLSRHGQPVSNDPTEMMMGRMGGLPNSIKDSAVERFREYVVLPLDVLRVSRPHLGQDVMALIWRLLLNDNQLLIGEFYRAKASGYLSPTELHMRVLL